MSDFVFNGISAASMGLTVERLPTISKPRKRIESVSVPGRSGNLHIWDGSFEDVTLRYQCCFKAPSVAYTTGRTAHDIAKWLYTAPVEARLEDTYDTLVFRKATFMGGMEIENILNRYGRVVTEFRCAPQCYLKSAEMGMTFSKSGGTLNNTSPFATKPLVRIVGSVGGMIKIGESNMLLRFPDMATHDFYLDCQEQEAWEVVDGVEVPSNAWVSTDHFLEVAPGINRVEFPSSFESVIVWTRGYLL